MNHRDAQRAISELMDGERLAARTAAALERHVSGCAECRAFEAGARRLREIARFRIAEPVPDLVEPILTAVRARADVGGAAAPAPLRIGPPPRAGRSWPGRAASVAAAVVVGLVAGSLTVGGPWRGRDRATLASAADVSARVAAAASRLDAYQARFAITEEDPTGAAPVREFSMNVWFLAPERFRLDVTDHTALPNRRVAPNDLQLIVNGGSSYQVAPSACPVGVCPRRALVVRDRLPFSSATPAPTDLILPVNTLVDAHEMRVIGRGRLLGRDALEVRVPFRRARPLFPFLDLGGSWRPFFPRDRVDLWLDAHSWFPLRYTVYPARGRARDEWQLRFGLPEESPETPIFDVQALSIDEAPPPASIFRIPHARDSRSEGAHTVPIDRISTALRFDPVAPERLDGLDLYRVVVPDGAADQAVVTYASGLSWLKLGETRRWSGEGLYGPVDVHARQMDVPGVGVAYYEPASGRHGRRLAIHTVDGRDLYLETNLPREALLRAAAALSVHGASAPASWLSTSSPLGSTRRATLQEAAAAMPFPLLVPSPPPTGYAFASAEIVSVAGSSAVNLYYQRDDTDAGGGTLRLHEERAEALPPASAARQSRVTVGGAEGRWTPGRHELEWVQDGIYYSLDGETLDLPELLAIAATLTPATDPSATAATRAPDRPAASVPVGA